MSTYGLLARTPHLAPSTQSIISETAVLPPQEWSSKRIQSILANSNTEGIQRLFELSGVLFSGVSGIAGIWLYNRRINGKASSFLHLMTKRSTTTFDWTNVACVIVVLLNTGVIDPSCLRLSQKKDRWAEAASLSLFVSRVLNKPDEKAGHLFPWTKSDLSVVERQQFCLRKPLFYWNIRDLRVTANFLEVLIYRNRISEVRLHS